MADIGFRQTNFSIRSINEIIRLALKENIRSLCYLMAVFTLLLTPLPANAGKPQIKKQDLIHASTHGDCVLGDCVNGHGTSTFESGDKYVGVWRYGKKHGQGTYTWENGKKYAGEWHENIRTGHGTTYYANKSKYVGEYHNNLKHGQGTFIWANGNKYIGDWRKDKMTGHGTFTSADGTKYVGGYLNDKWHGQGILTSSEGFKYIGGFRNGKIHGQGTQTFEDTKYVGNHHNGDMHGQGTFTFSGGYQISGTWYYGIEQRFLFIILFAVIAVLLIISFIFWPRSRIKIDEKEKATDTATKNTKRSDFAFWGGLAMCALLVIGAYSQLLKKNKQVRPNIVTEYTRHDGTLLTAEEVKEHLRIERISRKSEREARAKEPRYASRSNSSEPETAVDRMMVARIFSALKRGDIRGACNSVMLYSGPSAVSTKLQIDPHCKKLGLSAFAGIGKY